MAPKVRRPPGSTGGDTLIIDTNGTLNFNGGLMTGTPITTTGVGAENGATVTAVEYGNAMLHRTVLTLTDLPITMRDTEQGGGVKIYDFPAGRILFLGSIGTIIPTTHSAVSTLNAGVTCNWGVGSTIQANGTVATTEQNIIQVTAWTSSATQDVAPAASNGVGILTVLDGTSAAVDAHLNLAVAGSGDIDGNASILVTGTITITWLNLGDY